MASDKRELLLIIRGRDEGAKDALDGVAEGAEDAKDEAGDLNKGLKTLDRQMSETARRAAFLRAEISRSGDLGLVKDLEKAERELKKLGRQRKLIMPIEPDVSGFTTKLIGRLGPLMVTKAPAFAGAGGPIGLGLAAGAAPVLGATLAAAIIGGSAGVGVVGGLAVASRHPAVKEAAKGLGDQFSATMERSFVSFVPATERAIRILRVKLRESEKDFARLGAATSKFVEPLTEGIGDGLQDVLSGVTDLAEKAGPVVAVLGNGFRKLGGTIREGLGDLGDNANEAAHALAIVFAIVDYGVASFLKLTDAAAESFGWMEAIGGIMRGDPEPFIRNIYEDAAAAKQGVGELSPALQGLLDLFDGVGKEAVEAASGVKAFTEQIRSQTDPTYAMITAQKDLNEAQKNYNEAVKEHGKNSPEAKAALIAYSQAAVGAQIAAQGLAGTTSGKLTPAMRSTLIAAGLTAEEIAIVERQFIDAKRAGDAYAKTYRARIVTEYFGKPRTDFTGIGGSTAFGFSKGGIVPGSGPSGIDSVPALLAPREGVLTEKGVQRLGGKEALDALNSGRTDRAPLAPRAPARGMHAAALSGAGWAGRMPTQRIVIEWPDGRVAADIVAKGLDPYNGNSGEAQRNLAHSIRNEVTRGSGSVQRTFGY